jgi:hypothetical protein
MQTPTLRDLQDWDGAARLLAICLGLVPNEEGWGRTKHVFWSNNPLGNLLYETLESLVQVGVLESRDEPDKQYRWNPAFRGSDR